MSCCLEVKHLTVYFGSFCAVKNLNFSIAKGKTLAIVGESGSGKTVSGLSILRLLPSSKTNISGNCFFSSSQFNKVDLLSLPARQLNAIRGKEIGFVFQEPMTSLNPLQSCGLQIAESLTMHQNLTFHQAKERVFELFNDVLLSQANRIFHAYPHELSGGQKQRVVIALALANSPQLLIADEPTTALDLFVQYRILDLLKKVQEKYQLTMLFISHDLGLVKNIADEILVLKQSNFIESGSVHQIFNHPQQSYTKMLLACAPKISVDYNRLPFSLENPPIMQTVVSANSNHHKSPLLQVERINKSFSQRKTQSFWKNQQVVSVLEEISFSVFSGETLGIIGESGSGKSTLARIILKLMNPDSGRITWGTQEVTYLSEKKIHLNRLNYQMIFQDSYSALNPVKTVLETLSEPLSYHKILFSRESIARRVDELIDQVGLSKSQLKKFPHELSGGQRQRVCIARALTVNPKVIICDESVSALDVSLQAQILNLLKDLQDSLKIAYIFISHDINVIKFMSHQILVLQSGKMVEFGSTKEIIHHPKHPYTQEFIETARKFSL